MAEAVALRQANPAGQWLDTLAAWGLAILWILPLAYAVWTAFHPAEFSAKFSLTAPLTLENFARAWEAAPFARYFLNTTLLVSLILGSQLLLCTLAAYAFVRYEFRGKNVVFALVLVQLMIMPDVLLVENYKTMSRLGLIDTLFGIGLPYFASHSPSSCCGKPSRAFRRNWSRPPPWRAPARCRFSGASMCPSRSPCMWRLRWCR